MADEQQLEIYRLREINADLLVALKGLLRVADHTLPREWLIEHPVTKAKAAIAKAEGR